MFNTYARVFNDESDEDEASGARLLRESAGARPAPVAPDVLTSTSATRGRTQQAVQQRRGGNRADTKTTTMSTTSSAAVAAGSASVGNLIDFGDDVGAAARSSSAASARSQRSRGQPQPHQVELVTLSPTDPFDFLYQTPAPHPPSSATGRAQQQQQQQQQQHQSTQQRQQQHPLDFLLGPDATEPGRVATQPSSSSGAAGPGPGSRPLGSGFPAFGSFSDLLRPLAGGFGAAASGAGGAAPAPPAAASGSSASASSAAWGSFKGVSPVVSGLSAAAGPAGAPGAGAGAGALGSGVHPMQRNLHLGHSQSTNGIDDLLVQERSRREAEASSASMVAAIGGPYRAPGVLQTNRGASAGGGPGADGFDPFSGPSGSAAAASSDATEAVASISGGSQSGGARVSGNGNSFVAGGGSGGGEGYTMNQRELLLYAVPLFKDRLVFLPVVNWKDREDTSTVLGKVNAGVASVQQNLSHMWHSLKDKGEFSAKIYKAGQAILENMNAEERLMRNIPKKANKLVIHHPASIPPDEIQDQLTQLTSSFCYKSAGKAAVAGVMLPVAVGLEVIAVPGIGWYTAYQLFKSTSAAAGGSRLNNYLKSDKSEVRVCYAPCSKMDIYILKSRLNPDGVLGGEDIEDLCHDIREPNLLHPLTELRNRHLKKTQTTKADYALLPMSTPDVDEQYGSGPKKKD